MKRREYEPGVWVVWKECGMTMGQVVEIFRKGENIDPGIPITFTGRLDPLVTGLVVLLVGDRVHEKEQWTKLDKTYEARFLIGISTDTYDIFGIVQNQKQSEGRDLKNIEEALVSLSGDTFEYPYPPFSSKTVSGKPLWLSAREGEVLEERPKGIFRILDVEVGDTQTIGHIDVKDKVNFLLENVPGDFRQESIRESWKGVGNKSVSVLNAKISVGSGTYIRSLAHILEEKTGVPACIFSLERTQIGLIYNTFLE